MIKSINSTESNGNNNNQKSKNNLPKDSKRYPCDMMREEIILKNSSSMSNLSNKSNFNRQKIITKQ